MQRRQFLQAVPATLGAASLAVYRPVFSRHLPKAPAKPACLQRLTGHQGPVKGVEPLDERRLLSWSSDGTLRLWDGETGEAGPVLQSHLRGVRGVCLPSRDRAISWDSLEDTLRVWNLDQGYLEGRIDTGLRNLKAVWTMAPGRMVAWGSNGLALIRDGEARRLFDGRKSTPWGANLKGVNPWLQGVQLLADGRILSWSSRGGMRLWDGETGDPGPVLTTGGIARAVALPGNRLLTWGREGFHFWDLGALKPCRLIPSDIGWLRDAATLPDGRVCVWDYDGRLRILSEKAARETAWLEGHRQAVWGAMALSKKRLLSWSEDATLRIWHTATGRQERVLEGHTRRVKGATVLTNGEILSWSTDRTLRIWDPRSGRCRAVFAGHGRGVLGAMQWGSRMVSCSGDGVLAIWRT